MPLVLESVRHKLARAKHHLEIYKAEASRYAQNNSGYIVLEADRNVNAAIMDFETRHPIPPVIPLIVGDCLQNLRSTLDYLVGVLVVSNGCQPSEQNAFPICTTVDNFRQALKRKRLLGIDPSAITEVETFQPYHNGNLHERDPLYIMDKLTNINKHRRIPLAVLKADALLGRSPIVDTGGGNLSLALNIAMIHGDTQIPDTISPGQMKMNHQIIASIAFNEGCAQGEKVAQLLGAITKHVDGIVDHFEVLFA